MPTTRFGAQGVDAMRGGISSIFDAIAKAPLARQQAQDQSALQQAQIYAQTMAGNKYGTEAEAGRYTLDQRRRVPDMAPEGMPAYQHIAQKIFQQTGDTNAERIAQAMLHAQKAGNIDAVQAGSADPLKTSQAYFSVSGAAPFDEVGSTGRSMNKMTGFGRIIDEALAGGYDKKIGSEVGENEAQAGAARASAANSYAAANQHRASTDKIRQDIELGGRGVYDTNRGIIINPRTGEAVDVTKGGVPVGAKEVLAKALPTATVKDLDEKVGITNSAERLATSFQDGYGSKTVLGDWSNTYKRIAGDDTGQSQWWQDYSLHEAKVRNSLFGASLTTGEQAAWNRTAINPRMDAGQIRTNLQRRAEIERKGLERAMRGAAAGGYNRQQIQELTGREIPTAAGEAGAQRISSKQQYDALPSGARFIDPNGEERIKP